MSAIETGFNTKLLPEISPFSVLWEQTSTVKKAAKSGGTYEKKVVVVKSSKYANMFAVEIDQNSYQTLRLMKLRGINTYAATFGLPKQEGGFAPLILTGAQEKGGVTD